MRTVGLSLIRTWTLGILLLGVHVASAAGTAAPRFDLTDLDGKRHTQQDLQGGPTLVVFWASWCPVCQVELPKLHALFDDTKARGMRVLAIGFADDEAKIRNYVQTHPASFNFPVLYDPGDRVAKRFGVVGTPTVYLINPHGEIEYVTWLIEDPALLAQVRDMLNAARATERGS